MAKRLLLAVLLVIRFFFDWRLGSKFLSGERVKLNFCLSNQPYYSSDQQVFYYQNHFRKLKILIDSEKELSFGDCLQIIGEIEKCQSSSGQELCLLNPTINSFQGHFLKQIFHEGVLRKIRLVGNKLADFFLKKLPYPQADLLAGIVLGSKQNLDEQFYNNLKATGTIHIIVASGYNLTLIAKKPVEFLAYLLGRRLALVSGFFLIWTYVAMLGFEPPITRAGLMISFFFLARFLGKKKDSSRIIILTLWLMLMIKPDLLTNISFQLSVAALMGIVLGEHWLKGVKKVPFIGGDLSETLSAQLLVTPLILWHFGRFSWLSPLVNALILPLVPLIMALGLLALIFGLIWPLSGQIILWASYPLLNWFIFVIKSFAKLPWLEIGFSLNWWQVGLVYLLIFWFFHKRIAKGKSRKKKKTGRVRQER